jgi:hypothetical protein
MTWKDNNGIICWDNKMEDLQFLTSIYPKLPLKIMYRKKSKGKLYSLYKYIFIELIFIPII